MAITAGMVALELRRIADALVKEPEAEVTRPSLWFWCWSNKDEFLNLVRLLPRPLTKDYTDDSELIMRGEYEAIDFQCRINRSAVCTLIEPAKPAVYNCEPLLSDEEEAALTLPPAGSLAAVAPGFVTP